MYADDTTIHINLVDFTTDVREAKINAELEKIKIK